MIINDVITKEQMRELIQTAVGVALLGNVDMMRLIFEYGLDKTMLDYDYGYHGVEKEEVERDCLTFRLVNDGEEIEVKDKDGKKIIEYTCQDDGIELIKCILEAVKLTKDVKGNVKIIEDDDDEDYDEDCDE